MLKKMVVPTRLSKEFLFKYFNEETCYLNLPVKHKKKNEPHFSNVLCKFFIKDNCTRGSNCLFSHDPSQFKCNKHFSSKPCEVDNCRFRHETAEETFEDDKSNINYENSANIDANHDRPAFTSPFL